MGYIKGMLTLSIEGVNLERFINKCNSAGVSLYGVSRHQYDVLECSINYPDMGKIAKLNRELKCRIKIRRRFGLRFLLNRIARRKAFVVGAAMFAVFITVMSSSIWRIDISGTDRLTATQVIEVVNSMGAGVGIFKTKCDTKSLELEIKKQLPDVDWVIVEFHGVVMDIRIIETVTGVQRQDTTPASIVSEVDGEIISISVMRGDKKVFVGSPVHPGKVLIDGVLDRLSSDMPYYKLESAYGQIIAKVNYDGSASMSLDSIDNKIFTGNKKVSYTLELFGKTVIRGSIPQFEHYTEEKQEYDLFLPGRLFPIKAVRTVYREYTTKTDEELYSEAQEQVLTMAYNDSKRRIPIGAEVDSQSIEFFYDNASRTLSAKTHVIAIHEIGVRRELTQQEIDDIKTKAEGIIKNE